jgi:pyruvate,orthophosphate dikinase
MGNKCIFSFSEGDSSQKSLLGGKGANLSEMKKLNIPVPDGFVITTKTCNMFYENNEVLWDTLKKEINLNLKNLEKTSSKNFGGLENPLLVSVRSGAKISMPGMMDTILNLGLNFETVESLSKKSNNEKFAWDSFRRFIQMYANVVFSVPNNEFENIISLEKEENNLKNDSELEKVNLVKIINNFLDLIKNKYGKTFPLDPKDQIFGAIESVFKSWNSKRAIYYREINNIPHDIGTAVTVQMMVFGNMGETSGTGVCFTRNPSTGENKLYGEFLMNAQGEDVVAGIRTPKNIALLKNESEKIFNELLFICNKLENHFKDMQDIEFTIENDELFILQTRAGKRSSMSNIKILVDMQKESLVSKEEVILKVSYEDINNLLHPQLDEEDKKDKIPLCKGLPASPGGVSGKIVFNSEDVIDAKKHEEKVILVRYETSPEDIEGIHCAEGILTACGGMTSHAAVVARGMGKTCVSGAEDLKIDEFQGVLQVGNCILKKGDIVTIDGSTGEVFNGKIKKIDTGLNTDLKTVLEWAKKIKSLEVRANTDTEKDTLKALEFGAEGIGLCRTEHMFFEKHRVFQLRKFILAKNIEVKQESLKIIEKFQEEDFTKIFKVLNGKPFCIRLLDPPLHEFMPQTDCEIENLSKELSYTPQEMRDRIMHLSEVNPMLGHRGCRLLISYKDLLKTQIDAICKSIENVEHANVEIMIPLVSIDKEFLFLKKEISSVLKDSSIKCKIGTMLETPRGCLTVNSFKDEVDFFSFGTNDLTQMTFGFSRDDTGKFLPYYKNINILEKDPFLEIDKDGVGILIKNVLGNIDKNLKTSVCGEHGGNGESVEFFHSIGIKTVSCSPFRIPIAIIASAKAKIKENINWN